MYQDANLAYAVRALLPSRLKCVQAICASRHDRAFQLRDREPEMRFTVITKTHQKADNSAKTDAY